MKHWVNEYVGKCGWVVEKVVVNEIKRIWRTKDE